MDQIKRRPSTVEIRLVEDVYDAFQFDPKRNLSIGNRQLALGVAAKLLREEVGHADDYIAAFLKCSAMSIPDLVRKADAYAAISPETGSIIDGVRRTIPPKPQFEIVAEKKSNDHTVGHIALSVSMLLGVPLADMRSDARGLAEANARFVAIAVSKAKRVGESREEIAAYFVRESSFVPFAVRWVSTALKHRSDTALCKDAHRICVALGVDPNKLITGS